MRNTKSKLYLVSYSSYNPKVLNLSATIVILQDKASSTTFKSGHTQEIRMPMLIKGDTNASP